MSKSILDTTKKLVGIEPEYTDFDIDIITHINTVFFTLQQLGVGPVGGYSIEGQEETWDEFVGTEQINAVKSYMGLKVRLLFDPPGTSFAIKAVEDVAAELEYRLTIQQEGVRWQTQLQTFSPIEE